MKIGIVAPGILRDLTYGTSKQLLNTVSHLMKRLPSSDIVILTERCGHPPPDDILDVLQIRYLRYSYNEKLHLFIEILNAAKKGGLMSFMSVIPYHSALFQRF